jgi:predicted TIM-barrel fold metal-dependent hydrolase
MPIENPVFRDNADLARLPYFELREGRTLALADPALGPIADVHTHLALSYGPTGKVDLWRRHDETEHYLPVSQQVDLDVYANRNFTEENLKTLTRDLTIGSLGTAGMRRTHTAPNLIAEMSDLGIAVSVLLPIDFPVLSHNAETYLEVAKRSAGRLVSLGSVHPFASRPEQRLAEQKEAGARGVKVHPAVQSVRPDHPRAMRLYRACGPLGLPVLWHCGPVGIEPRRGRELSQLKHYWRAIHDHPDTTFVLGHSGALQWTMALELIKTYPNVYLEVASQSLHAIGRLIDEAPTDRLMLGSDWPFYHQGMAVAKVLMATEERQDVRRRILWDNAAELFGFDEP